MTEKITCTFCLVDVTGATMSVAAPEGRAHVCEQCIRNMVETLRVILAARMHDEELKRENAVLTTKVVELEGKLNEATLRLTEIRKLLPPAPGDAWVYSVTTPLPGNKPEDAARDVYEKMVEAVDNEAFFSSKGPFQKPDDGEETEGEL